MKIAATLALIATALYAGLVAIVWLRQESLLFFPDTSEFAQCQGSDLVPLSPIGQNVEGRDVHYLLRKQTDPVGAIIVFHGNAGSACGRTFFAEMFRDQPYDVILAEYPGYSGLPGPTSEAAILSAAHALVTHIRSTIPNGGPLILLGESLGSGVATSIASQQPVSGLILIAPYTSIAEMAKRAFPWLPTGLILKHTFRADEWAKAVKAPVLIIHGEKDATIPYEIGKAQSANFSNLRAFVPIPDAGHNDWLEAGGTLSIAALHTFVESFIPREP